MKKSKQEIERHYFELFSKVYSLPEGKVVHNDKPDFIISGRRKIGIEITNSYIEDGNFSGSEQIQMKGRADVLSEAQKQYLKRTGKNIEVSFSFDNTHPIRDEKTLTKKIADLVRRIDGLKTGQVHRDIYKDIPELNFVYVNSKIYNNPKWRVFQVYTGSILSPQKISEILIRKEKQAREYTKCDEYWLLIVIDFMNRAQDQEIPADNIALKSNIYKKIIIYKTVFNHVQDINIA